MVATAAHGPSRNPQSPAIRLNQGYDVDVDPAHIEATRTAFHIVCDSLQLECDVGDPITEIIVTKIIALGGRAQCRPTGRVLNDLAKDAAA
jgi:hypothetical protein